MGEMDEIEVDLREYFSILWRRKWLVLATFLGALGLATLFSLTSPRIFRAETVLGVKLPQEFPTILVTQEISNPGVVEIVKDPAFLEEAGVLGLQIKAEIREPFVSLALEGPLEPNKLEEALSRLISTLQAQLSEVIGNVVAERLVIISSRKDLVLQDMKTAENELEKIRHLLEEQRTSLLSAIDKISQQSEGLALGGLALNITPEAYLVTKELDVLYVRLQEVELELDRLARGGVYAVSWLSENYKKLASKLKRLKEEEALLRQIFQDNIKPLQVLRGPRAYPNPVRPGGENEHSRRWGFGAFSWGFLGSRSPLLCEN
ncbi:MAG: Wzz/FepE/Etk N-terminal domain-containing protein [Candidatus Caldatribacteriaceae bacterium]